MSQRRILVTGAAGAIGRTIIPHFRKRGYFVRGLDLPPSPIENLCDEYVAGSIVDAELIERAMASCDTVVHLAATPNDNDFFTHIVPNNIIGPYNVLEAARKAGTRRAVLASTVQTVNAHPAKGKCISIQDGPATNNRYGVSKVFLESLGQMYQIRHGMEVVAIRVGWFPRNQTEFDTIKRGHPEPMYFSHNDACRFFTLAVEHSPVTYALVFGTSCPASAAGRKNTVDLKPARELLGYVPEDTFPAGSPFQ